jgi:hypothetical protein
VIIAKFIHPSMTKTKENENQHKNAPTQSFLENSYYMKTIFLIITLFLTVSSTLIMSVSIMSNYWEYMTWNKQKIREIIESTQRTNHNHHVRIEPIQSEYIIKLSIKHDYSVPTRLYLLPMHGGIWTVCASLTGMEFAKLGTFSYKRYTNII